MTLHPQPMAPIPEETARVARAAFPRGNPYMRMRDELGVFYQDEAFAALFPARGQPAESPWRLALVLVLQYAEGLSDRQAADAVRSRIDWKYALSLELTDPGFDASVLSEFRSRLVAGSQEQLLLDAMLDCFRAQGLLKARGRQRTDSTAVLAAIRTLNRLECVGETLRHALNRLALAAPEWLRPHLDPAWAERYGPRFDEYRLPKGEAERQALAEQIGRDGFRLLAAIYAPEAPAGLRALPAVEALRQVWLQQFYAPGEDGATRWRAPRDLPPAARMINSPHDLEARYTYKRSTSWIGYKAHLTETCEPDAPHLITEVATTVATTPDGEALPAIHQALARKALLPREHLVDAVYVDGEILAGSQREHGVSVLGPVPQDCTWQARAAAGFDVACFAIDWEGRTATCPAGRTSTKCATSRDRSGHEMIHFQFARRDCQPCAQRAACTTARAGRRLTVRPKEQHLALQAARQYQTTPAFKMEYDARAGVEGTISQGLRVCALRRARYIGLAKTHLQHVLTAAAPNVLRIAHWLEDPRLAQTRQAPFLALLPQVA
ncbi:MAG TPA: IS1182 family transposase [Chloroflexota bacterium]|nr:IS1182 family transposase [Chloroflexota bacterium]